MNKCTVCVCYTVYELKNKKNYCTSSTVEKNTYLKKFIIVIYCYRKKKYLINMKKKFPRKVNYNDLLSWKKKKNSHKIYYTDGKKKILPKNLKFIN
jgi:hypothetical protein